MAQKLSEHLANVLQAVRESVPEPKRDTPFMRGYVGGYEAAIELVRDLENEGVLVTPLGDES